MNVFRVLSVVLVLSLGLQALPAAAMQSASPAPDTASGDPTYTIQNPPAYAMIGDLVIARPLLIAATAIGAVLFVVALPFAALGGNVKETGKALVVDPGRAAFVRCLGCTTEGDASQP
ncbi:multidrug transporter [Pseudomonas sp. HR96]|uniref:multidrug transporter n=1 Tax=Pseudomonas sp. HR96 TaxID=1027966 RepID=UPI002A74AA42|nr:multidrug transporter [Pseudomonas sp. HR96]WPP00184.1 multidrug transporter [Pseudomonas sp. HR96]